MVVENRRRDYENRHRGTRPIGMVAEYLSKLTNYKKNFILIKIATELQHRPYVF